MYLISCDYHTSFPKALVCRQPIDTDELNLQIPTYRLFYYYRLKIYCSFTKKIGFCA